MVALTGVEPDGYQSSSVQLGLSGCVFSAVGIHDAPEYRHGAPTSQRSHSAVVGREAGGGRSPSGIAVSIIHQHLNNWTRAIGAAIAFCHQSGQPLAHRSEEHTSELQSPMYLV